MRPDEYRRQYEVDLENTKEEVDTAQWKKTERVLYRDLKEGDLFQLSKTKDKRVFRRDKEGATKIVDDKGRRSPYEDKCYPYLTMPVYRWPREETE